MPCYYNAVELKTEVIYERYADRLKRICDIPDSVKWSYEIKVKYAPNIKAKLKTYKKRKKNVF